MEFKDFKMSSDFLIALFTVILATICLLNGSVVSSTILMILIGRKNA
ncbi:hypothetical protein [Clostridium perfringens]|nr:hypothetical protein [Clostridium perfringens]EDT25458.1 hypothetical protein AC5_A0222 [Clostridium perfringens CPE str. F4969]MBI6051636.1 hypothetical protein [Clostridium perfringens]MDM0528824.1 hypothetical protein [Clostridium perfringens]HBI7031915.1 hypothetical protein [Clostridium perfringens]